MNKLKLLLLLLIPISIKAECTNNEITRYKNLASNINNYYEYNEKFDITLYNVSNELIIKKLKDDIPTEEYKIDENSKQVKIGNIEPGTRITLGIYSKNKECDYRLRTININVPYLNKYYQDKVCENNDNPLCSKWINTNSYTYEQFVYQVTKENKEEIIEQEDIEEDNYGFFDFLRDFYMPILIVIIISGILGINYLNKKDRFDF